MRICKTIHMEQGLHPFKQFYEALVLEFLDLSDKPMCSDFSFKIFKFQS